MMTPEELQKIETCVKEFFEKTTFLASAVSAEPDQEGVQIQITMPEPKFFIGQNGQTLLEAQRVLRMVLNRALQKNFHVALDINDYRKQKVDYVKKVARDAANEVALSGRAKSLPPMSAYDRRLVHMELAGRQDVVAESQGDEQDRHVIIKPAL